MELEVVLDSEDTPEKGQSIAVEIMGKLGIMEDDLVSGAYADLLLARAIEEQER